MDERNDYNSIPMQSNKTAMQELIDELELIKGYHMMPLIIRIAKDRLEKEKEQIIEAYCKGNDNISAEEYYNRTYKQNK
jgi:hypothetical protein